MTSRPSKRAAPPAYGRAEATLTGKLRGSPTGAFQTLALEAEVRADDGAISWEKFDPGVLAGMRVTFDRLRRPTYQNFKVRGKNAHLPK